MISEQEVKKILGDESNQEWVDWESEREIHELVDAYKGAEDALLHIEAAQLTLEDEFELDLQRIDSIQKRMAKRLQELLSERGVDQTSKQYDAIQKDVRKKLFPPMVFVVDSQHPAVSGKTYEKEAFKVTLVEQKPKLVPRQDLSDAELREAHKHDINELVKAGLYNLISIPSDDNTVAFVRLRADSDNPLHSVELERSGYCKVVLT